MPHLSQTMAAEIADTWDVMAATEKGAHPARRATLRECADLIRMLASVGEGVLEKIGLYTKGGDFVADVSVPAFRPKAEVIFWGSRTFVLAGEQYREGLCWVVREPAAPARPAGPQSDPG